MASRQEHVSLADEIHDQIAQLAAVDGVAPAEKRRTLILRALRIEQTEFYQARGETVRQAYKQQKIEEGKANGEI